MTSAYTNEIARGFQQQKYLTKTVTFHTVIADEVDEKLIRYYLCHSMRMMGG
jgi:hypothetical protein